VAPVTSTKLTKLKTAIVFCLVDIAFLVEESMKIEKPKARQWHASEPVACASFAVICCSQEVGTCRVAFD
jgi:hypothetical protein